MEKQAETNAVFKRKVGTPGRTSPGISSDEDESRESNDS
jgi:hypothetical protein